MSSLMTKSVLNDKIIWRRDIMNISKWGNQIWLKIWRR
jgi:hypothetical protein